MFWHRTAIVGMAVLVLVFLLAIAPLGSAQATFIDFTIAVSSPGAPTDFAFTFATPIVGLNAPVLASYSISVVMTDATGDGVSMGVLGSRLGLGEGNLEGLAVLGVGGSVAIADADSDPAEPFAFTASNTVLYSGGLPPYDSMEAFFGFHSSGNGDTYAITGHFEVVEAATGVPAPAPLALMLGAALVVGAAAYIRRQHG